MKKRKIVLMVSVFLFTSVNVALHFLLNVRFYFLFYLAISNGVILGFIGSYLFNKILEEKEFKTRFLCIGIVVGMIFLPVLQIFQINNEFSSHGVYVKDYHGDYFQYYITGFIIASIKSFYYSIIPSIVIFALVGFLFKIYRRARTK